MINSQPVYPTVFINGQYVNKEQARLGVGDLALLRGYGVFDYFRYANGQPRFLQDHLARFERSAGHLGLDVPGGEPALRGAVFELIRRNERPDGGIRFVLTGGYSENGYAPAVPNLIGLAYPFTPPPARLYERGAVAITHHYERQLPEAKTIDYLEGIRIIPLLKRHGADYVLYVDRDDNVRESDRSNYLVVKDGRLITPKDNILMGVTRRHVLLLARRLGLPTEERPVAKRELYTADELIICSSVKGVLPLTRIDGKPVGAGGVGALTKRLMDGWGDYVAGTLTTQPT